MPTMSPGLGTRFTHGFLHTHPEAAQISTELQPGFFLFLVFSSQNCFQGIRFNRVEFVLIKKEVICQGAFEGIGLGL